jgi:hypothetical protein
MGFLYFDERTYNMKKSKENISGLVRENETAKNGQRIFPANWDRLHDEACILSAVIDGIWHEDGCSPGEYQRIAIKAQEHRFLKVLKEETGISLSYVFDVTAEA